MPRHQTSPSNTETSEPTPNVVLSNEQFQQLLGTISSLSLQANTNSVDPNACQSIVKQGNFAKCTSRFDGAETSSVEAFIDAVQTYKSCANVSDTDALKGLPMLLTDLAATWYQGIKHSVSTWADTVTLMRQVFGRTDPPYKLFLQLFSQPQHGLKTELFVCNARAILSKLPYTLPEYVCLDMVYGLLDRRIGEHIPRSELDSFMDLLVRSRHIETTFEEDSRSNRDHTVDKTQPSKPRIRPKCTYCHRLGHYVDQCRTKEHELRGQTQESRKTDQMVESSNNKVIPTCYGCGTAGFIRSKCPKCNKDNPTHRRSPDVHPPSRKPETLFGIDFPDELLHIQSSRPVLPIKVMDEKGIAYADTGATRSVAGKRLFDLVKQNVTIKYEVLTISLADGTATTQEVPSFTIEVEIESRKVLTTFLALPNAQYTLLGADFLCCSKVVLDVYNQTWHFAGEPDNSHHFPQVAVTAALQTSSNISTILLQENEATLLNLEECGRLSALLCTRFAELHIRILPGTEPISLRPYQLNRTKREILKQEIDKMLENDIIEECESPWAAPVVMVNKPDGSTRICIDYQQLNRVTISDKYPMPRIDDLLHGSTQTKFMSTIDLQAGYWQIAVAEEDRDKTAFITPFGLFRFKRMPFGLKNAPAVFQRLIDKFKTGLNVTILAYLDDLLILSDSFESHLKDLKIVFDRLKHFKLRANRKKCHFVVERIKYLGHVLTPEGICANPEKVSAIANLTSPKNIKELRTFIQTCSWYRKFVPNFAAIAKPLTDLTRKNAPWKWTEIQEKAFILLRNALITAPILRQADENIPFVIRTDASAYAIGAVLLQGERTEETQWNMQAVC